VSFNQEPIPYETHSEWFMSKVQDQNCALYIALDDEGTPLGQVRFDLDGTKATISISLAATRRGRGYGARAIRLASEELLGSSRTEVIHAYVRLENEASRRAFLKAGYADDGVVVVHGAKSSRLAFRCPQ
jgi:UDP-2,4-diacetamido-2,4,6-trideoxy-beta-L-altropyranose hydrolase